MKPQPTTSCGWFSRWSRRCVNWSSVRPSVASKAAIWPTTRSSAWDLHCCGWSSAWTNSRIILVCETRISPCDSTWETWPISRCRKAKVSIERTARGSEAVMTQNEAGNDAGDADLMRKATEALPKDGGRGLARIDPSDMTLTGIAPGDVIRLTGKRTTVAKAMPAFPKDRGKGIVQIDGLTRHNAGAGLGE